MPHTMQFLGFPAFWASSVSGRAAGQAPTACSHWPRALRLLRQTLGCLAGPLFSMHIRGLGRPRAEGG